MPLSGGMCYERNLPVPLCGVSLHCRSLSGQLLQGMGNRCRHGICGEIPFCFRHAGRTTAAGNDYRCRRRHRFSGTQQSLSFWNAQQLCDIHGELGEDALCETCRLFPASRRTTGILSSLTSPRLSGSGKAAVFADTEAVAADRTQFSGNNRGTAGICSGEHAAAARTTTSIIFSVTGRFCFCLCTTVRLSDTCGTMGRCFAGTDGCSYMEEAVLSFCDPVKC